MSDRTPISPQPLRKLRPEALPAYISNGLVGLRLERQPIFGGSAIVSGYAGRSARDGVVGFSPAPYPCYGDVLIGDAWISNAASTGRLVEIRHDFATGEVTSRWHYEVHGVGVDVDHVVFCSRSLPTLVVQELTVTVDRPTRLAVRAGINAGRAPGRRVDAAPIEHGTEASADLRLRWRSLGDLADCGVAYGTRWLGPEAGRTVSLEDDQAALSTTYAPHTSVDGSVRLQTITSMVPSYSHMDPDLQAARLAARGLDRGFERMRDENRAIWQELWRSRILLGNAATRWQALTDASLYYLQASVHRSTPASTSLFGLAYWPDYDYYHGHPMWDLDTFVVPPLSLLQPDAARALLDFRVRTMPAAKQNAALNGQAGALFPWEAGPLHGYEATPKTDTMRKDHVTLDVALGALRYIQASGDARFAVEGGRDILLGVAEWAASRVRRTCRGFEIDDLTGPAETVTPVVNDAWTMAAAKLVLEGATALAQRSGIEPPRDWLDIAEGLVLPIDPGSRVLANHDGYSLDEPKGGTPEGAAAIFPLGWNPPAGVEEATYRFAIEQQAPSYIGTPMFSAFFGVWAARLGRREEALDLLERGYAAFFDDPFMAPDEVTMIRRDHPRANPMFANLGGYLTSLLFGFPGVQLGDADPSDWVTRRTQLPKGWRELSVESLSVRGSSASLDATHGRRARLAVREPGKVRSSLGAVA